MTVLAVVSLRITNPESLESYRGKAADALARHGGTVVEASRELTVLEGHPVVPDALAIVQFPDRDAAQAWIGDPELADIHALRRGSGSSEIILM